MSYEKMKVPKAERQYDLPRPRDRTNPKYHEYVDRLTAILKEALSGGVFTKEDKAFMEFIQGKENKEQ